jgi:hypothetical protein
MNKSEQIAILKAARILISDPKRWTQSNYAKNKNRSSVDPTSPKAVCWCALGALQKVVNILYQNSRSDKNLHSDEYHEIRELLADQAGERPHVFNDTHTHSEVLDLFDRTIKSLEA